MKEKPFSEKQNLLGTWYAILAFGLWGILPTYWKLLQEISPYEIVVHRVLWTCLFTGSLLLARNKLTNVKSLFKDKTRIRGVVLCALLLGINWLTFVYAINTDKVLDASMGYYINPLVSVFLGLLVLKERVNFWQKISIILAFIGVFIITFQYGKIPWIALTLAFTFGLYGLIKKIGGVDAVTGLHLETLLLVPVSLVFILIAFINGKGAFVTGSGGTILLLVSTGLITGIPLLFFAGAALRIPLSRVGFIQYLTPTCFFLLGRFVYREAFSTPQFISFVFIWAALALYSLSGTAFMRKVRRIFTGNA